MIHERKPTMPVTRHIQTPIMNRLVEAGGLVFIGGTTADDKGADITGQTEQILAKLDDFLAQIGSDRSHVVQAAIYMTDLSMKADLNAVWTKYFEPQNLPARAAVGVALATGTLVEITFVVARI